MKAITFIDLFAGIGGFHAAFHEAGAECVFASEIDKRARLTYEHNFRDISPGLFAEGRFNADITAIDPQDVPAHDILCAGFPCQPFSQAGYKRGFKEEKDARGNMFFIIRDIIRAKRPAAIFLENVRHLLKHDNGRTFAIITDILTNELDYDIFHYVVKASEHGLPQHRPRVFIIGFRREDNGAAHFAPPVKKEKPDFTMSDVFGGVCDRDIGYTLRVGGRSSGIHDRRNWDCYRVNGEVITLQPQHGIKMMGFPEKFSFPKEVPLTQRMKQLGNSVAVSAVKDYAYAILKAVNAANREGELSKKRISDNQEDVFLL